MDQGFPKTFNLSKKISEELTLSLFAVKLENASMLFIYDQSPKFGSLSVAIPTDNFTESRELFGGKQGLLSSAMGEIFSKRIGKGVYCSVNISDELKIPEGILIQLVNELSHKFNDDNYI